MGDTQESERRGFDPALETQCTVCRGTGYLDYKCEHCDGTGMMLTDFGSEVLSFIRRHWRQAS